MQPPGATCYTQPVNLSSAKALIVDLESNPRRVELFAADLEAFIAWSRDAIHEWKSKAQEVQSVNASSARICAIQEPAR